jgi:hypothetical protein
MDQPLAGSNYWSSIALSSDGTRIAACDADDGKGYIWTSTGVGGFWTRQTTADRRQWFAIASSSDGTKLAACDNGGDIYTGQ